MKTFCLLVSIFVSSSLYAIAQKQLEGIDAQNNLNALGADYSPTANNMVRTFDGRYRGFKGTACVFDKWYSTEIFFTNGTKYENQPCKFDIYKQQDLVVFRKVKRDSIILQPESIKAFVILNEDTGKKHLFKKYFLEKGSNMVVFCEVLSEGKHTLLLYREKTLLAADYKGGYSAERFYDEFLMATDYYIVNPDKQVLKLKKSEKAFLKLCTENQSKMKDFLKENPLDFKKEETIAKAIAYYNSLL